MVQLQQGPVETLREMAFGFITARSIYAVAKLGIADLIKDGARTAEELADKTGGNAHALYRIMRTLSGEGIFHEDDDGRFSLTPIGQPLRTDIPDSLSAYIIMNHGVQFQAWTDVLHSVDTGEAAVPKTFGKTWTEIIETNPEHRDIFHEAMMSVERTQNPALSNSYDFSKARMVADLGGGNGSLLSTILTQNKHLSGILLELEPAIATARAGPRTWSWVALRGVSDVE